MLDWREVVHCGERDRHVPLVLHLYAELCSEAVWCCPECLQDTVQKPRGVLDTMTLSLGGELRTDTAQISTTYAISLPHHQ